MADRRTIMNLTLLPEAWKNGSVDQEAFNSDEQDHKFIFMIFIATTLFLITLVTIIGE